MIRNKMVLDANGPVISEYSNKKHDGSLGHFVANAFIFKTADNKRYIGAQSIDITDRKTSEEQIKKIHERFSYVVNATSEAIWDFDLKTNEIYRNDAFYTISGYSKKELASNLDWWFDKVHPEDKERVKKNFEQELMSGKKTWEDEYRFQYADGTYRNILDKGFAIFENNKPVRLIGAIQDITARKKLESQLLHEQVKKQKLINQATIDAQEKERNMISAELHDNVNQLLMSAKLHIGAAKHSDIQDELLDKASDYLLQAVEEIRSLSKRLNTSIVRSVGLEESIFDICRNMKQFNDITVSIKIDKAVIDKLTKEQQLVVFRIIQEQSNNIIKYSRADAVTIALSEKSNQCSLLVSDNGIGFDKEKQKANGIGFINIFNRVDAYNGKVEIITYPDNGCTLNISIPYVV
jgi:PAS domain S-box-containing protein